MLLFCHRLLYQLNVNFHIFHKTLQLLIHCISNFFLLKRGIVNLQGLDGGGQFKTVLLS